MNKLLILTKLFLVSLILVEWCPLWDQYLMDQHSIRVPARDTEIAYGILIWNKRRAIF